MQYKVIKVGSMDVNCIIVWDADTKNAAIVDPGYDAEKILSETKGLNIEKILVTHGHFDHIGVLQQVKNQTGAKVYIHSLDADMLIDSNKNLSSMAGMQAVTDAADVLLKDGDIIKIGDEEVNVIHLPGHTKGGLGFIFDDVLLSGDTLFKGSIGRCDLPGGDMDTILKSIADKIAVLDADIVIIPGHGDITTLSNEFENNPFVSRP